MRQGTFVDYLIPDPLDDNYRIYWKRTYAVRHDGLVFAAGSWDKDPATEDSLSDPDHVVATIYKAGARLFREGPERTFQYYNTPASIDGERYVFIAAPDGTIVADATMPELLGINIINLQASDDPELGQKIAALQEDEELWISHMWQNPESGQDERKHTYVTRFRGIIFGSGYYGDAPPPPTDPCGETVAGDGAIAGEWASGCDSETVAQDGSGAHPHARFYSFTLAQQAEVTITLDSNDADTYLYLRAGEARSGDFLYENDDYDGITKSQIQETLDAGTYTIEATTDSAGETGSFTLTIGGLGTTGSVNSDQDALVALYGATDGANWTNNDNWLSDVPIGQWYGVTTDSNGRVIQLNLISNQLTGAIPAELGDLANLEILDLIVNRLAGEIPDELGNLTNLRILRLNENQLTGEIPSELGSLTNLEILALGGNQLTGPIPTWLGSLSNLQQLDLAENQLSGAIPAELGSLSNLQELYLWGNQLTGPIPSELGSLTNLQRLSLSDNQLSGPVPTWLGSLTNLQQLDLAENQLTGPIPTELGSLTNLEILALRGNQLTGPIPTWLGGIANLQQLDLAENQLTGPIPSELGSLTNLEILALRGNQLTGPIPSELGGLANLQTLYLSYNQLTGCVPDGLRDVQRNDFGELGLGFCGGTPPVGDPLVAPVRRQQQRHDREGRGHRGHKRLPLW